MDAFFINSTSNGTRLIFSERKGDYFKVEAYGPGFQNKIRVYTFDPTSDSLAGFFSDLADTWRGWPGTKNWASLEGELSLSATSDSLGHIELLVRLSSGQYPSDWHLSTTLVIEAGQLEQLAAQIGKFMEYNAVE